MRLAEEALRKGSVRGKVYNIVDGGPPVGSFAFWFPLIKGTVLNSLPYHIESATSLPICQLKQNWV